MIDQNSHKATFERLFGTAPILLSSGPGRVNLIGEHTDYNGGFVLPAAIERNVLVAAAPASGPHGRLYSVQHQEFFHLDGTLPKTGSWPSYFVAVAEQFRARGHELPPIDALIDGDVPLGAGLSSSAAYEVAVALLYDALVDACLTRPQIALLAQAAENGPIVGMRCGIMDQFISANGEEGRALFLDCHSLDFTTPRFAEPAPEILIVNSMKKRGLVESAYNDRRHQCEEALQILEAAIGRHIPTLRHLTSSEFEMHASHLSFDQSRRVRHNLTENQRVKDFCRAMELGDWKRAGNLLYESHGSLRDDYEVSCAELDAIVGIARETPGVYGCRMTGAGFGGCCVALTQSGVARSLADRFAEEYTPRFGLVPTLIETKAAAGGRVWAMNGGTVRALAGV